MGILKVQHTKGILILLLMYTSLYSLTLQDIQNEARRYTKYHKEITAMAMVETDITPDAIGDSGESYGVLQVQISTLRWLAHSVYPKTLGWLLPMPNEVLQGYLMNYKFNTYIASLYLNHLIKHYGYFSGLSRYNGGARNIVYYNKVQRAMSKF